MVSLYDDCSRDDLLNEISKYRKLAAENGTKCFRLATALKLARQWGISSRGWDGDPAVKLADWVDAGMPAGIPWPSSPFAQKWLQREGYSDCDGCIGMRATMTLAPESAN